MCWQHPCHTIEPWKHTRSPRQHPPPLTGYHPTAIPGRDTRPRWDCQEPEPSAFHPSPECAGSIHATPSNHEKPTRNPRQHPPRLTGYHPRRCRKGTHGHDGTVSDGDPSAFLHLNVLAASMPHHRAMEGHTKPQAASAAIDGLPSHGDAGTLTTATVRLSAMAIHPPPSFT